MYASILNAPDSLFGHFERLRRELDDVFGTTALPSSIRSVASGSLPPLNVGRTAETLEVYAFAPGLDTTKIEVTIDRGVLRLAGERTSAIPTDTRLSVYAKERTAGRFIRAIALPDDVDPEKVKANYRDGVLQVSIGRKQPVQPQRITVQ